MNGSLFHDVKMPGFHVPNIIAGRGSTTPVIVMNGHATDEVRRDLSGDPHTYLFEKPLELPELMPGHERAEFKRRTARPNISSTKKAEKPEARRASVLIVEDNADIRTSLEELLDWEDFDVRSAKNGAAALALLSDGDKPNVILLDLMMPTMDGFEFRKHQTEHPALKDIPTIVFTCGNFPPEKVKKLGNVMYLKKPISMEALISTVRKQIRPT